jgi:RNA polymerase sigma-70 factor (ECF subfamily)
MESSLGSMAVLGQLLDRHREKLLGAIRRRIDPALSVRLDPEDVLNNAYLVAQRKYAEFRESGTISPFAWLYGIARDCLIDAWRRETRDRRDLAREMPWPADSIAQLGLGLRASGTSPSEAVQRKQLQERVRQLLELLRPADREVLWMRHFDQLSHRETAEVLGITENAATVRYARALCRLRDLHQSVFGELEAP